MNLVRRRAPEPTADHSRRIADCLVVADDLSPPPTAARRVLVAGTSGAGKTSMAVELARLLAVPHVEIDALFHGQGWVARPQFEADVLAFSAGPAWVTEWQYSAVRPLLAARADTLVWLDYSRWVVMWRVCLRTLKRRLGKQVLWNGNVEPPLHTLFTDDQNIIRWAWGTHVKTRTRVVALLAAGTHLTVVRLRTPAQARDWLLRFGTELLRQRDTAASIDSTGA